MTSYRTYNGEVVFVSKRLRYLPCGQAGVRIDYKWKNNKDVSTIRLMSYSTVAAVFYRQKMLEVKNLQSRTTIRHVSCFIREFCPGITYQMAKKAYQKNCYLDCVHKLYIDKDTGKVVK